MKINSIVAKAVEFAGVAYLDLIVCGTAYPTWQGNRVLAAHVVNADEKPGVFSKLRYLGGGEYLFMYNYNPNDRYTYLRGRYVRHP